MPYRGVYELKRHPLLHRHLAEAFLHHSLLHRHLAESSCIIPGCIGVWP